MKRCLSILWVFLILCGPISFGEAVVDRIVAVVNQEIITLSEVEKLVGSLREIRAEGRLDRLEKKKQIREVQRKALEQLIDEKLVDHEVKKQGIKVTAKDVEATVDGIKQRNGMTQEQFESALTREGLTLDTLKKQIEKRLLRTKLIQYSVKVEPKNEERELKDFYQKNIDLYRGMESYRTCHILFRVPKEASPEEVREIKKKCQKVLEKIKGGEDFGEMALLYSEDVTAKDRGDLGYFNKGELLPAFEREALRLEVGEVSGIVRTDYGFHLIKMLDRRGRTPPSFEEVKEKVRADYYEREMERAFKQFLSSLREKSVIEIKL